MPATTARTSTDPRTAYDCASTAWARALDASDTARANTLLVEMVATTGAYYAETAEVLGYDPSEDDGDDWTAEEAEAFAASVTR